MKKIKVAAYVNLATYLLPLLDRIQLLAIPNEFDSDTVVRVKGIRNFIDTFIKRIDWSKTRNRPIITSAYYEVQSKLEELKMGGSIYRTAFCNAVWSLNRAVYELYTKNITDDWIQYVKECLVYCEEYCRRPYHHLIPISNKNDFEANQSDQEL